jgi:hypothetical protein
VALFDEVIPELRALLGDDGASPKYTDAQLETLWVAAARRVVFDTAAVGLARAYALSVADATVTPDPTAPATPDPEFVTLATAHAACLANQGAAVKGAGQAIAIGSTGGDRIDLKDTWKARESVLRLGACAAYKAMLAAYLRDRRPGGPRDPGGGGGRAVVTPVRVY